MDLLPAVRTSSRSREAAERNPDCPCWTRREDGRPGQTAIPRLRNQGVDAHVSLGLDTGAPGSQRVRSRWLPLPRGHLAHVQPVVTPPPARCLGRSRSIPARTLGAEEWTERTNLGLLPLWWRFAYLYRNFSGPDGTPPGHSYYPAALYTATCTRFFSRATATYHAASKIWSAYDSRAHTKTDGEIRCRPCQGISKTASVAYCCPEVSFKRILYYEPIYMALYKGYTVDE